MLPKLYVVDGNRRHLQHFTVTFTDWMHFTQYCCYQSSCRNIT